MKRVLGICGLLALATASRDADAATYLVQPVVVCDPAVQSNCGLTPSEFDKWMADAMVATNLQWQIAGISYHAEPAIFVDDAGYAQLGDDSTSPKIDDLIAAAGVGPSVIPIFFTEGTGRSWNGIPDPSEGPGFHDDDVIFTSYAPRDTATNKLVGAYPRGLTFAHELGHFWSLKHTHTQADPGKAQNVIDRDGDDCIIQDDDGNWVYDDKKCFPLWSVLDTPDDPAPREGFGEKYPDFDNSTSPAKPIDGKEWCRTDVWPADPGSPKPTYCTPDCKEQIDGVTWDTSWYPDTSNLMSYYSDNACKGPYWAGSTSVALTADQLALIWRAQNPAASPIPERLELVDRCEKSGNSDFDAWCDGEDLCPTVSNGINVDSDGDGLGNECDLCPKNPKPSHSDLDMDGIGDVCDADRDGDGCLDGKDQHPDDAMIPANHKEPGEDEKIVWEDESLDTDGDGLLNCEDTDDDDDGKADGDDSCILHENEAACLPLGFWSGFDFCDIADCEKWVVKLVPPCDPLAAHEFADVTLHEGVLYMRPLAGHTAGESAYALSGALPTYFRAPDDGVRQLVAFGPDGQQVELLDFEVNDGRVRLADIDQGQLVRVAPSKRGVEVSAVWSVAQGDETDFVDADRDAVPDFADNCLGASDWTQLDADHDGYGNVCDADLDQDGLVDERDLVLMKPCFGVDLTTYGDEPVCDQSSDDLQPIVSDACAAADLDGDWLVGERDLEIARRQLGNAPGPSARH